MLMNELYVVIINIAYQYIEDAVVYTLVGNYIVKTDIHSVQIIKRRV